MHDQYHGLGGPEPQARARLLTHVASLTLQFPVVVSRHCLPLTPPKGKRWCQAKPPFGEEVHCVDESEQHSDGQHRAQRPQMPTCSVVCRCRHHQERRYSHRPRREQGCVHAKRQSGTNFSSGPWSTVASGSRAAANTGV